MKTIIIFILLNYTFNLNSQEITVDWDYSSSDTIILIAKCSEYEVVGKWREGRDTLWITIEGEVKEEDLQYIGIIFKELLIEQDILKYWKYIIQK